MSSGVFGLVPFRQIASSEMSGDENVVDGAGGVTAREHSELLRRQQQADAKRWEEMEKKVKKMEAEQLEAKKKARKAAVKAECDKYTNKSIKRGVKVQMETLHLITDLEEVWEDLAEADTEGVGVISAAVAADKVEECNEAVSKMTTILARFRLHSQWELDMQIAAGSSTMGWGTVEQWELKKKQEEGDTVWSMTPEAMRKIEQEKLTYDRQLRLAGRGRICSES